MLIEEVSGFKKLLAVVFSLMLDISAYDISSFSSKIKKNLLFFLFTTLGLLWDYAAVDGSSKEFFYEI